MADEIRDLWTSGPLRCLLGFALFFFQKNQLSLKCSSLCCVFPVHSVQGSLGTGCRNLLNVLTEQEHYV